MKGCAGLGSPALQGERTIDVDASKSMPATRLVPGAERSVRLTLTTGVARSRTFPNGLAQGAQVLRRGVVTPVVDRLRVERPSPGLFVDGDPGEPTAGASDDLEGNLVRAAVGREL